MNPPITPWMPPGANVAFAAGKLTWGICDTCGQRYRLRQLKEQWDGFKACPECFDLKQPQLDPPPVGADPEAILNPRPDRTEPAAVSMLTSNPLLSTASSAVIKVFRMITANLRGIRYALEMWKLLMALLLIRYKIQMVTP